jgi:hypothetical protein
MIPIKQTRNKTHQRIEKGQEKDDKIKEKRGMAVTPRQ